MQTIKSKVLNTVAGDVEVLVKYPVFVEHKVKEWAARLGYVLSATGWDGYAVSRLITKLVKEGYEKKLFKMLVHINDIKRPVGIVVEEITGYEEKQYYVIYPVYAGTPFCIVGIEFESTIIAFKNPYKGWKTTGDHAGYGIDEQTQKDLYSVWDDGANAQIEASKRLYARFEKLIDESIPDGVKLMTEINQEVMQAKIAEAKKNGWDTNLIQQSETPYPYEY